jgi:hypothetical protein
MQAFLDRHGRDVIGTLAGYDRMLFRGCLRSISYANGLERFLGARGVRYAEFKTFALGLSERLKGHAQGLAKKAGRPFEYLPPGTKNKEQVALNIAQRDGITEGLICVLRCVEPCVSYRIRRGAGPGGWGFVREQGKCLFLYFYVMDREFGLMHVRLQTWLPFDIQVCINGREYLARQMVRNGIGFEQRDNCFTRIDDLPRAQELIGRLETRRWAKLLNAWARRVNPLPGELDLHGYYWSLRESEYATDVMFRDTGRLKEVYPALVDHALRQFNGQDVLKFLGRRTNCRFNGEVCTNVRRREEGVRIKHWVEENSIKMYDKQGSVLRIETTLNNVRRFKVRRRRVWGGQRKMRWVPMRKGIMDLPRRTETCRAANERYLKALGVVGESSPTRQLLDPVSRRVTEKGRPYRALRPVSPEEARVFEVVLDGRYLLKGFKNADIRRSLGLNSSKDPQERRRGSGRVTRLLGLLRAHHLIGKVSGTRYYRVTDRGQHVMGAALKVRNADVAKLAA